MMKSGQLIALRRLALAIGAVSFVSAAHAGTSAGEAVYSANCASCHGAKLGGAFGPALSGPVFQRRLNQKGGAALKDFIISAMPPAQPGSLNEAEYVDVANFILAANNLPSLEQQAEALRKGGGAPSGSSESGGAGVYVDNKDATFQAIQAQREALTNAMKPVSEQMLRNPPNEDWINWRRTDDGHGFSPLTQINSTNAGRLQLAWSLSLPAGTNQITPLVHDGILFVNSHGTVQALDAGNGDLLWKFSRQSAPVTPAGPPSTQPRNMAIYGTTLFVPTLDNHMLALDARTGALRWDHQIEKSLGVLRLTGGPMVVHGKVIQGVSGCSGAAYAGGCFIVALDAQTGTEAWRFNTIARPGQPYGDTWNAAPLSQRFGASIWSTATYDEGLNLLFIGTGQTYHITPLIEPKPRKAGSADALFTDTTLALNPDTGKLVWHYQHHAREVWDLDWAFERTLLTLPSSLGGAKVLVTMGKLGILDALDAKTGRYLFSRDSGLQTLITSIDPHTGHKTSDPKAEPEAGKEKFTCPFPGGVRSWPATAYDPGTKILYVPMFESCMNYLWKPGEGWDIQYSLVPPPNNDGNFGRVAAINLETRQTVWQQRRRASSASAIVATAGGVIFEGSRDRWFRASDSATGKVLWQTRLDLTPNAFPIVFGKDGTEYVAITTGGGGPVDVAWQTLTPELVNPAGATTLFVFKLAQ
jgi:alcohol dehydrogenase (cytochrome c)